MNIELMPGPPGRSESARARAGSEQAQAADAFAGLFASLAAAGQPAPRGQAAAPITPAPGRSETAQEPELPIWPGLVQGGLPAAAQAAPAPAAPVPTAAAPLAEQGPPARQAGPLNPLPPAGPPSSAKPRPTGMDGAEATADPTRQANPQLAAAAAPGGPPEVALAPGTPAEVPAQAGSAEVEDQPAAELRPAAMDQPLPAGSTPPHAGPALPPELAPRPGAQVQHPARADRGPRPATPGATVGPAVSLQLPDTANGRAVEATAALGGAAGAPPGQPETLPLAGGESRSTVAPVLADPGLAGLPTVPVAPARSPEPALALPLAGPGHPVPASALAEHAVAIIRELGEGRSQARIELHPAELGHLDLELRQDGQKLDISVAVDNEQSRRLVQDQFAQWRERLADSGIALQGLNVALRERDDPPRQDSGASNEHAAQADDVDVNNPSPRRYQDPSRSLDLYA